VYHVASSCAKAAHAARSAVIPPASDQHDISAIRRDLPIMHEEVQRLDVRLGDQGIRGMVAPLPTRAGTLWADVAG
jgi:hypothetical protein